MLCLTLALVVSSAAAAVVAPGPSLDPRTLNPNPTCVAISNAISSASQVYYQGSIHYTEDVYHYATSSSQIAACSVEPGSVADVSKIIRILANTTTPFAVKGGGHALNPGFSSTTGVQIAMTRFNAVNYIASSSTVEIGTGLIWDDVYAALEPFGVNVVGGRVSGVGVAGFSLGGGFSWLTNLHGLTVDTITAIDVVLPSGEAVVATPSAYPDLFFGLKGGQNNFGIVTKLTLKAFPQTQVWGGTINFLETSWPALTTAVADFSANNVDPNANIIQSFNVLAGVVTIASLLIFYNAPTPPPALYAPFLSIPAVSSDVSTRSFSDFVKSAPANATANMRGLYHSVSLAALSPSLLTQIVNQTLFYGASSLLGAGFFVSYDIEPFIPAAYIAAQSNPSAWPHSKFVSPLNLYFAWPLVLSDGIFHDAIVSSASLIKAQAIAEGQDLTGLATYTNYAVYSSTIEEVYGENAPALRTIKAKYDPGNVMGRAGGWKL